LNHVELLGKKKRVQVNLRALDPVGDSAKRLYRRLRLARRPGSTHAVLDAPRFENRVGKARRQLLRAARSVEGRCPFPSSVKLPRRLD